MQDLHILEDQKIIGQKWHWIPKVDQWMLAPDNYFIRRAKV